MKRRPPNLPIPQMSEAEIARFHSYVRRSYPERCWPWRGGLSEDGHGQFTLAAKTYKAPRIALYLETGEDPGDKMVCHTCRNPRCCNRSHLYAGTAKDNSDDKLADGTQLRGEKHPSSKLTCREVRAIRVEYAKGCVTLRALGKRFGVNKSTIAAAVNGDSWGHVK